jgi:cytochrome c
VKILVIAAVFICALCVWRVAQASQERRSVSEGVYTAAQAMRGREIYRKRCVLCHLDDGQGQAAMPVIAGESLEREGDAEAPAIAGEPFQKKWNGRTALALFGTMASTMPVGGVGSLSPAEYADVLAYLFVLNKYPAGTEELSPALDRLESITIGK